MSKLNIFLIFLTVLALSVFANDKLNENGNPWNGYSFGSWIIVSDTKISNDKKQVKKEKKIKVKEKDRFAIYNYLENEGKFPEEMESMSYHIKGFDPSTSNKFTKGEIIKEVLKIDGKDYECAVETYNLNESTNGESATIKLWKCESVDIPYRELQTNGNDIALGKSVLKAYCKKNSKKGDEEYSHQISKFKEEIEINKKKVICIIEEIEGKIVNKKEDGAESENLKGKGKRWLTIEIPGHISKEEAFAEIQKSGSVIKYQRLLVIEDFEVIKN
jgi:hypothetical protein